MKRLCSLLALVIAAHAVAAADDYPKIELRNAHLAMTVLKPDAKKSFYRGSRFDWSGVIRDVQYNTHTLFKPWKDKHDPANADDITGPCEEFRTPLGYDTAKEGETFLKIGVGTLVKPKEDAYRFNHNYAIKYPGLWEITRGDDEIGFKQGMLTDTGYGYKYIKTISLLQETSGFTIKHELENVGMKRIIAEWYNHNFYNLDSDPIGKNYIVRFPFAAKVVKPEDQFAKLATVKDRVLTFSDALEKGSIFAEIEGFGQEAAHHGFTIHHAASRVTMRVQGDAPLSKFNIWGVATTICPEPYIAIDLKPGESKTWTLTYQFVVGGAGGIIR